MTFSDLRAGFRALLRAPVFSAAAILTLALGIGGNVAIFSIVDRVVLRDLPFPESRRLVRVYDTVLAAGGQIYRANVVAPRWQALAAGVPSFDRITAQRAESLTWIGRDAADAAMSVPAASVSPGTLALFGVWPVAGRAFLPSEERLGSESRVVLVSHRFWRARLGGDPAAIGAPLRFADGPRTVVGVLPEGFHFPYHADFWLPLAVRPGDRQDQLTIARLAPGATLDGARREIAAIAARLAAEDRASRGRAFDVMGLKTDLLRDEERVPLALMAAVGFLLLLGCANLSALLLSRSVARRKEMAIRAALGATRGRQLRQLLTESLLLALPSGVLGLAAAVAGRNALFELMPRVLGEELHYRVSDLDPGLLLFTLVLSAAAGVLFGLAPALRAAGEDPAAALASDGRSASMARGGRRTLSAFVVGEVAIATVLLAGAALMIADLARLETRPLGLEPRGLLSLEVPLASLAGESGAPQARHRTISSLLSAVRAVPGVRSAAATTINPFWGATWGIGVAPDRVDPSADFPSVNFRLATPGLFRSYETAILAGRDFGEEDRDGAPPVAIVSRHLARRFWPAAPAVGQGLVRRTRDGAVVRMRVVGVAADVRDAGELEDAVYLPYAQLAGQVAADEIYVMVRGPAASGAWIRDAARAVGRADPRLAVAESETMDVLYGRTLAQSRVGTSLLSAFAGFGLLLATIGIFGVVAFHAGQRRVEMAIRTALGAAPGDIRKLILAEGVFLGGAGSAAGLALALVINRLLSRALHDFPANPWLSGAVALCLFAVTVAAASVPALRAARTDPNEMLRGA